MGLFSKDIKNLEDLYQHGLKDIYYAENQIVKALPKLIDRATSRELAAGLRNHLRETEIQVTRLEQVFEKLGRTPKGVDCPAIDGLIKEADEVAEIPPHQLRGEHPVGRQVRFDAPVELRGEQTRDA